MDEFKLAMLLRIEVEYENKSKDPFTYRYFEGDRWDYSSIIKKFIWMKFASSVDETDRIYEEWELWREANKLLDNL